MQDFDDSLKFLVRRNNIWNTVSDFSVSVWEKWFQWEIFDLKHWFCVESICVMLGTQSRVSTNIRNISSCFIMAYYKSTRIPLSLDKVSKDTDEVNVLNLLSVYIDWHTWNDHQKELKYIWRAGNWNNENTKNLCTLMGSLQCWSCTVWKLYPACIFI